MAVAMVRTAGSWRGVSSAMAASSVRCAVESTRTVQRVLVARKGTAAAQMWISSSGDGAQLRCQAATLTAARELATADGAVERRGVEESRAALRGSFDAASVSGSAQECRPVWDEAYEQSRMYYGRRGGGDARSGMATTKVAGIEEEDVQAQMGRSEAAGRSAEALCEMATRAWRRLGDAERAEQLFLAAVQLAPGDCAVQACYAQFLWQCDA